MAACQAPDPSTKDYIFQQTMFRIKDPKASLAFYTGTEQTSGRWSGGTAVSVAGFADGTVVCGARLAGRRFTSTAGDVVAQDSHRWGHDV